MAGDRGGLVQGSFEWGRGWQGTSGQKNDQKRLRGKAERDRHFVWKKEGQQGLFLGC